MLSVVVLISGSGSNAKALLEAWLAQRMQGSRAAANLVAVHERLPTGRERSAFYVLYDWHAGETLQQLLDKQTRVAPSVTLGYAMQALLARLAAE